MEDVLPLFITTGIAVITLSLLYVAHYDATTYGKFSDAVDVIVDTVTKEQDYDKALELVSAVAPLAVTDEMRSDLKRIEEIINDLKTIQTKENEL